MLHNKTRKCKGEKPCLFQRLRCKKRCKLEGLTTCKITVKKSRQDYGIFMIDSSAVPIRKTSNPVQNDLLVSLLSNESRDVEIINTRSAHHRSWEVIGRPSYETWWRRGNRRCRSGRRN
jgi:Tol biopolymer transport system component